MGLFDGSERLRVFVIMNIVMTVVGTVACSLNIAVIKRMPTSGYLLLLLTISIFQFMEDITFFFANVNVDYWVTTVAQSFQVFGGVGGALMSNFISFIVLYIVAKRKSFNIFAWYKYMLGLCIISAIANVIMYLVARIPENNDPRLADLSILWVYYYIRLVSIFANFIMFGISAYCIRATRSMGRKKTEAEIAVTTLCGRLIFYPIVQAVGRSGYAFYEAKYDGNFDADNAGDERYAGLLFLTLVTPLVSVGYLLLFMLLQPGAYDEFRAMLGLPPRLKPDPPLRQSRASAAQQTRSTVHMPRASHSVDNFELTRKSTVGGWQPSPSLHCLDAAEGATSERGTSFAGWAKSSMGFIFEEDGLGVFDGRTEEELFAALADQEQQQDHASMTELSASTTNSLHSMHSQYGHSLSLYSSRSISTASTLSAARKMELSSLGGSVSSAGVRSTESSMNAEL